MFADLQLMLANDHYHSSSYNGIGPIVQKAIRT